MTFLELHFSVPVSRQLLSRYSEVKVETPTRPFLPPTAGLFLQDCKDSFFLLLSSSSSSDEDMSPTRTRSVSGCSKVPKFP